MKMKVILIGALILAACLVPGCLGDKIVGTWKTDTLFGTTTITFNKDNTGVYTGRTEFTTTNFTWEKDGDAYKLMDPENSTRQLGTATLLNETTLSVNAFGLVTVFTKV